MRFREIGCLLVAIAALDPRSSAAQGYKVAPLKEPPPGEVAAPVRTELAAEGLRIETADGKPYADLWLRKAIPSKSKPAGPEGAVQFPFLAVGEILGAIRYTAEGHDYRDQAILPGVYTIRFGLHPINGDHLGVSPYRDFALLLPAESDPSLAPRTGKDLEQSSAEAAGSNHPAVLVLSAVPPATEASPAIRHNAEKNFWGVVLPLQLKVGDAGPKVHAAELVFDAIAAQ
jgi:hypothetical protein